MVREIPEIHIWKNLGLVKLAVTDRVDNGTNRSK